MSAPGVKWVARSAMGTALAVLAQLLGKQLPAVGVGVTLYVDQHQRRRARVRARVRIAHNLGCNTRRAASDYSDGLDVNSASRLGLAHG